MLVHFSYMPTTFFVPILCNVLLTKKKKKKKNVIPSQKPGVDSATRVANASVTIQITSDTIFVVGDFGVDPRVSL